MPIVSFTFDKMQVERLKPIEAPLKVKQNMIIEDVKVEEVPISKGKEKVLRFFFSYEVDYEPNQAKIELKGNILFHDDQDSIEAIYSSWEKEKKFKKEVMQLVMNNISIRSNIKALTLGQDIGLPPHIVLPTLQNVAKQAADQKKAEEYIG
jgi:hypothetical protein